MSEARRNLLEQIWRPALRLIVYYLVIVVVPSVLVVLVPWFGEQLGQVPEVVPVGTDLSLPAAGEPPSSVEAGLASVLTMLGALLLVLPIVWVYTFARQRRGFQQSLAQTLVILPVVVAVVVFLVKHSVALAFSLGGIVGAVAFRHRLEDTKDAVYIFVTIAIGVAVGVQAYSVALATSVFFNVVALGLWVTDFARAPAPLAAAILERRVRLAKDMAPDKRTGEYVAQLDQHILQSMTPDQLKALADRAMEHSARHHKSTDTPVESRTVKLIVRAAGAEEVAKLRPVIAGVLEREAKAWRPLIDEPGEGEGPTLRFEIRCRKKVPAPLLLDAVQLAAGPLGGECSFE